MKLRRVLGAVAAASVAISVPVSAASVKKFQVLSAGSPSDNVYRSPADGKIDLTKVKTVKAVITSTVDGNGGLGCNDAASGKWVQTDFNFTAGTQEVILNVDGITVDDSAGDGFVVQLGIWWMNGEGTLTIDSLELLDADGKVPEVVVVTEAPADTTTPADTTAPADEAEPTVEETVEETVEVEDTTEAADVDVADYFDGGTVYLLKDDGGEGYITASGEDITEIYGVKFNVTFDDAEVANDDVWVGGGVGANSNSTGWEQHEWGKESGMKEITPDFENGTITWYKGSSIFSADDEYAQLWIQSWGGSLTVDSVELLYADYDAGETTGDAAAETADAGDASDNKGNPDTGVAGVAVAAGVVALAGAAVVVSRKRK